MKDNVEERAIQLGRFIAKHNATVRLTAKKYNISKSTVHKDVSERLKTIDMPLYKQVRKVLDKNKLERHIRGGIATKEKYEKLTKNSK